MGIQGEPDKATILAHFAQLLSNYSDLLILSVKGLSPQTRAMATDAANVLGLHIWEDMVFLVMGDKTDMTDEMAKDFQMWTNEFNQS